MKTFLLYCFWALAISCLTAAVWSGWRHVTEEMHRDRVLKKLNRESRG